MKVLIIGGGGREHTLAWVCSQSEHKPEIYCAPGNGGTESLGKNVWLNTKNVYGVANFVIKNNIDLTIIGPEAPLVAGLGDELRKQGCLVFGPNSAAAQIEGSKVFAKRLMLDTKVPTAESEIFTDYTSAAAYIAKQDKPLVVKASGLAGGKGVIVCDTNEEALAAAEGMLSRDAYGAAGREIIIEERLIGREMSLLAIADGTDYILLPPSRDHKRALNGDKGSNTGGMGAYAPLDDVDDKTVAKIAKQVFNPVLAKLSEFGIDYSGCLYAGLMLTKKGPKVLEFNCRFGDPETQAVLPLLDIDVFELLYATAAGDLKKYMDAFKLKSTDWRKISLDQHAVSVVMASKGYPGEYRKGMDIANLPTESENLIIFHAGTTSKDGYLLASGGRVLAVTAKADTHENAVKKVYENLSMVNFRHKFYRDDIGRVLDASK